MREFPVFVPGLSLGFCAYCHLQLAPALQGRMGAVDVVTADHVHVSLECLESADGCHHADRD